MSKQKMKDADLPLRARIEAAIERVTTGQGQMRVPVEATDPDVVLFDCLAELDAAKQLNADWEAASLVGGPRIDALRAELDAAHAREAKLRAALDSLADAVEGHQSHAWATSDIDTALARAALAEGEDTRV